MNARCSQAFANALTINALTLQIAIVWTSANCKFDVLNIMLLKSAASGCGESNIRAHVATKRKLAETHRAYKRRPGHIVYPH